MYMNMPRSYRSAYTLVKLIFMERSPSPFCPIYIPAVKCVSWWFLPLFPKEEEHTSVKQTRSHRIRDPVKQFSKILWAAWEAPSVTFVVQILELEYVAGSIARRYLSKLICLVVAWQEPQGRWSLTTYVRAYNCTWSFCPFCLCFRSWLA
jgi:hypothetical protein